MPVSVRRGALSRECCGAAKVTSDGRRVTITPEAPLAPASTFTLRLDAGLESFGEQPR